MPSLLPNQPQDDDGPTLSPEEHVRALRELLASLIIEYGIETPAGFLDLKVSYRAQAAIPDSGAKISIISDPRTQFVTLSLKMNPPSVEPAATPGRRRVKAREIKVIE